ncbi:WXG100 family type VII secretion target [Streptomyces sp. NPDC090493]|uniref:WXG100 family type VII secretion target n=1 Tax=Streptomyces sp. NPDC090493 TaxID=3365964 RepID=UPI003825BF4B
MSETTYFYNPDSMLDTIDQFNLYVANVTSDIQGLAADIGSVLAPWHDASKEAFTGVNDRWNANVGQMIQDATTAGKLLGGILDEMNHTESKNLNLFGG